MGRCRRESTDAGTSDAVVRDGAPLMSIPVAWTLFPLATLVSLGASVILVIRLERVAARLGCREATLGLIAALAADGPEATGAAEAANSSVASALSGLPAGARAARACSPAAAPGSRPWSSSGSSSRWAAGTC